MRFGLVKDFENVIKGGLWFIEEHFLTVRAWEPNFKPANAMYNMVAVWIRLLELPFDYYDPRVLKEVGSAIGSILRVDSNTTLEVRGRFTRICIQVNLDKPLITSILLEGVVQEVLYEGINTLCFSCGQVGHRREGHSYTITEKEQALTVVGEASSATKKSEILGKGDGKEAYGPWLLVRRKKAGAKN